jgi:hypothetical protein
MVVIGHSMGGCISRLLITDSEGEKLWTTVGGKPPSAFSLSPESRKLYTRALVFHPRTEFGRVIFISSPLRGAEMAEHRLGRLGSKLIKSPAALLTAGNEFLQTASFGPDELQLKRIPNSVDTLAPNAPFVKAINTIPPVTTIPYHVICGDRGKGGNKDHTKPVMSDGLVPYWSSHMETARSELIIPSHHSAQQHPQGIAEVRRILRLHTGY